jgi:predicted phage terminase large subunit-like protein
MTTNVFWPAWEWGPKNLAHYRYISFSHEQNLATRDLVRGRNLMNSEWYQQLWGNKFKWKSDQNAKTYYENDNTGWRQACAADSMTGRRGDRVIGDDPHTVKGAESDAKREDMLQTFSETIPTRLNKMDESAIVVIMQRVHEKDVSGLILANEMGYEHLMLPMEFEESRRCFSTVPPSYMPAEKELVFFDDKTKSWVPHIIEDAKAEVRYNVDPRQSEGELLDPVRFSAKSLEELKSALRSWGGSYAEAGQLQQRPAPRGGGMFKKEDWKYIEPEELRNLKGKIVRGYDLAASDGKKSPYTVGLKMMLTNDKRIIILDVDRYKKTPGLVEQRILSTAKSDGKKVIIDIPQDPGQAGKSQKAAFARLLHGFTVRFSPESGSKEIRATPLASQVEGGNVYLVRAPWNDAFTTEGSLFPNSEFKDQIDAASRAYSSLIRKPTSTVPAAGEVVTG